MKLLSLVVACCVTVCWAQTDELDEPLFPQPLLPVEWPADGVDGPVVEDPLVRCKRPLCDVHCPYGHKLGEDGCDICDCKTPEDLCLDLGKCEEGKRCHVPTCMGEACANVRPMCITECPMFKCVPCESGLYKKDHLGCQTCECDVPCAMPMCANRCEHGYAKDENDCMTCECNAAPPPLLGSDCHGRPSCRMFCEHGFKKGEDGCDVCECRDEPEDCPEAMCLMYCDYGFRKNDKGCNVCECRSQPVACSEVMCTMFCENGFEKDEHGCDMCKCKTTGEENVCATIDCAPDMTCHEVKPFACPSCSPVPRCRPLSICQLHEDQVLGQDEEEMLKHHLTPEEVTNLFSGPAKCQRDGSFMPKQCWKGSCFCVDDRGVMYSEREDSSESSESSESNEEEIKCEQRLSDTVNLSFKLAHDMEENDLDGALRDIQALIEETVGGWMNMDQSKGVQVFHVGVMYLEPGVLMVEIEVTQDGMTDLAGSSHHMHKHMRDGHCDLHYKDHVLRPDPDSVSVRHSYPELVIDPAPEPRITTCWGRLRRHHPIVIVACAVGAIVLIIIIITVAAVATRRRRSASYQFKHKKMENMETFKKNLIMSSEWEKPELVCKDEVKVAFSDDIEKKPLA